MAGQGYTQMIAHVHKLSNRYLHVGMLGGNIKKMISIYGIRMHKVHVFRGKIRPSEVNFTTLAAH